ncbi:MAG TPA: hypothetical protein VF670_09570 [Duganella sp.]
MNQQNTDGKFDDKFDDKRDPQDPERMTMQPPIPTHPADPQTAADVDKVAASPTPARGPSDPPPVSTGIGSGPVVDAVGGAGLGQPPGDAAEGERPATTRDRDVRAVDQQDRTGQH